MNSRAQVSVEYLLTVMFAIGLAIAVTIIAFNVASIADTAQLRIVQNRDNVIASLLG